MINIARTISLEQFKSRMASVIASVGDNSGEVYNFSTTSIFDNPSNSSYIINNNYGLIPSEIILENTPLSGMCDVVSYHTLKTWFHFLENYVNKLTVELNCGVKVYSSATEYNKFEEDKIELTDEEKFIKLGGLESYEWLCNNVFISFSITDKSVQNQPYYVANWHKNSLYLPDFVKWLGWFTEKAIEYPSEETICSETKDCCECEKFFSLGGHDMLNRMRQWRDTLDFNVVEKQTSSITINNTELFVNDGQYYDIDTSSFKKLNENNTVKIINFSGYIEIPILLTNEIDDIGNMSILADEWTNLVDYGQKNDNLRLKDDGTFVPFSGGTIIIYNDKEWILNGKDGKAQGYYYSKRFKEGYFGNTSGMMEWERKYFEETKNSLTTTYDPNDEDWERYFYKYANAHMEEFKKASADTYAYKNETLVLSPSPYKMSDKYYITHSDLGFILINGTIYKVFNSDYILHTNYYLVNYVNDSKKINPYITFFGKKIYGTFLNNKYDKKNNWYFNFNNVSCISEGERVDILNGNFISLKGNLFECSDGTVKVINIRKSSTIIYEVFYDYITLNGKIIPLNINEKKAKRYVDENNYYRLIDDTTILTSSASTSYSDFISTNEEQSKKHGYFLPKKDEELFEKDGVVYFYNEYTIYNSNYVSGITESKLNDFKSSNIAFDDLGNELPGFFNITQSIDREFAQPQEGEILDLYFEAGTVANIENIDDILYATKNGGLGDGCVINSITISDLSTYKPVEIVFSIDEIDLDWIDIEDMFAKDEDDADEDDADDYKMSSFKSKATNNFIYDTFDYVEDVSNTSYYWGDILSSMEFYVKDEFGRKVISVLLDSNKYDFIGNGISYNILWKNHFTDKTWKLVSPSLVPNHSTVKAVEFLLGKVSIYKVKHDADLFQLHGFIFDDVFCDFEYYNGAIISREYSTTTSDTGEEIYYYGPYKVSYLDDGLDFEEIKQMTFSQRVNRAKVYNKGHDHFHNHYGYGVRHVETCKLILKETEYCLNDTYSFNVLYYKIDQPYEMVQYRNAFVKKNVCTFETSIGAYDKYKSEETDFYRDDYGIYKPYREDGKEYFNGEIINQHYYDESFVDDNGFIIAPVFRQEYKFGISSLEKVNGNIYIDRGKSLALDKHFKLLLCKSFEALERYGNGYFKINDK